MRESPKKRKGHRKKKRAGKKKKELMKASPDTFEKVTKGDTTNPEDGRSRRPHSKLRGVVAPKKKQQYKKPAKKKKGEKKTRYHEKGVCRDLTEETKAG